MPWSDDGGGAWNAVRCTPLDPDPKRLGEACIVETAGNSGVDDCAEGAMCWGVDSDSLTGRCVALCKGSEAAPWCPSRTDVCVISNEGVLTPCVPACDPLAQDCRSSEGCIPVGVERSFVCIPTGSGEPTPGAPCDFVNECAPGLMCARWYETPSCNSTVGCCAPYCDVTDPGADAACAAAYPTPGAACVPFYAPDPPLPGYEDVGVCVLPP